MCRGKLKLDLVALCAAEDGLRDRPVPVLSQSVMWSFILLCTTSESVPTEVRRSARQQVRLNAPFDCSGGCSGGSELAVPIG